MKRLLKPCSKIGCHQLTRERYCEEHKELVKQDNQRDNKAFYQSKAWQNLRQQALIRDAYLCVKCKSLGFLTHAVLVDHIVEVSDNYSLRLVLDNLQSLCHPCHNKKTAEEKRKRNH